MRSLPSSFVRTEAGRDGGARIADAHGDEAETAYG